MATTPSTVNLTGRLQLLVDGHTEPIELGEVEVPIRVQFGAQPGPVARSTRGATT